MSDVLENLQRSIDASGAEISHGKLPAVYGDRSQMMQLIQNLVSMRSNIAANELLVSAWLLPGETNIGNSLSPTTESAFPRSTINKFSRFSNAFTGDMSIRARE